MAPSHASGLLNKKYCSASKAARTSFFFISKGFVASSRNENETKFGFEFARSCDLFCDVLFSCLTPDKPARFHCSTPDKLNSKGARKQFC